MAYLYASLPQVDAKAVGVSAVVIYQLLKGPEGRPPGNEEPALVELPDAIVLDGVAVPNREREVVPSRLGVPDEEGAVLVLGHQQLLLRLDALDLAEVPSEKFKRSE